MAELLEFLHKDGLSEVSRINYIQKITRMMDLFDTNIENILEKPDLYIDRLKKIYKNIRSLKAFYGTLLSVYKYNDEYKKKNEKDYEKWYNAFKSIDEKVVKETSYNQATNRQVEGWVDFDVFRKKLDTLPVGSKDRLLIAMYSLIRPLRADMNAIRIYHTRVPKEGIEANYIVLTKKTGKLVLTEYKTSRKLGKLEIDFPPALVKEIHDSLQHDKREWLFESKGMPYNASTFNKWVNSRFKALFDKPLTISILRHSYVNTIDLNNISEAERAEIARTMGHTASQQLNYRLLNVKKE